MHINRTSEESAPYDARVGKCAEVILPKRRVACKTIRLAICGSGLLAAQLPRVVSLAIYEHLPQGPCGLMSCVGQSELTQSHPKDNHTNCTMAIACDLVRWVWLRPTTKQRPATGKTLKLVVCVPRNAALPAFHGDWIGCVFQNARPLCARDALRGSPRSFDSRENQQTRRTICLLHSASRCIACSTSFSRRACQRSGPLGFVSLGGREAFNAAGARN